MSTKGLIQECSALFIIGHVCQQVQQFVVYLYKIVTCNNLECQNYLLCFKEQTQRVCMIWCNVYEILEQAKLIYNLKERGKKEQ